MFVSHLLFACMAVAQPPVAPHVVFAPAKPDGYAQRLHDLLQAAEPIDAPNRWVDYIAQVNFLAGIHDELAKIDPAGQAAAKIDQLQDKLKLGEVLKYPDANPATAAWLGTWFDHAEEAHIFAQCADLSAYMRFVPPVDETDDLIERWMPEIRQTDVAMRLLNERFQHAADKKDYFAYTESFAAILTLGRAASSRGADVGYFIARRGERLAFDTMTAHLIAGLPGHDTRVALLQAIDHHPLLPATILLKTERLIGQSQLSKCFDQIDAGKKPVLFAAAPTIAAPITGTRQQNFDRYNEYMDAVDAAFLDNSTNAQTAWRKASALLNADNAANFRIIELLNIPWYRQRWDTLLFDTQRQGLRILLALSLYHDQHNAYPDTLAALAPDFLPTLPDDPANPGHPFCYRRIDPAADALHREFLLYSTGLDQTDNHGVTDENNIHAFHPTPQNDENGVDYVINWTAPRPAAKKPADTPADHSPDAPKP